MPSPFTSYGMKLGGTAFAGGVDPIVGGGPTTRIVVSGTWTAGKKISLDIVNNETTFNVGNNDMLGIAPVYATSFRNQVFVCAGDKFYFSGIQEPTGFEDRYAGYGFIQVSGQRGEALECLAVVPYGTRFAAFARNVVQIWQPNADPTLWALVQVLDNSGTCGPRSVTSFGDLDVFYLADSGVRSLRTRESLDLAVVKDVGTPIDPIFQPWLLTLTDDQKNDFIGLYSTSDGRYWLLYGREVYVFNFFAGSGIAAWSKYDFGSESNLTQAYFNYVDAVNKDGQFYLRRETRYTVDDAWQGDSITIFPSIANAPTTATIVLPFFDAKLPATRKTFQSIDLAGSGSWVVSVGDDLSNEASFTQIGTVSLPSMKYERIPIGFVGTHLIIKLVNSAKVSESADRIASVIVHYQTGDAS